MTTTTQPTALPAVRQWLVEQLDEELDGVGLDWDVKPGLVTPGQITKPTVYVEFKTIEPTSLPPGSVRCIFDLTVADFRKDISKAEDAVDEQVLALILALDSHPRITWSAASKVTLDPYLAWQLTVTCIASATPTPTS